MAMKTSYGRIIGSAMVALLLIPAAIATTDQPLRVVELFTSHGCSSCPPADRLLGELLEMDDSLMALEYHVDYWNSLVHGNAGSWADPFSSRQFTDRQREYNAAELAGRGGVYTPQAIVNGQYAAVGSDRRGLQQALQQAGTQQLDIAIAELRSPDGRELSIRVSGSPAQLEALKGTTISLVRYMDSAITSVTGGENKNLELVNHHIVFDVARLGKVDTESPLHVTAAAPAPDEGCIVVVQEGATSPVYAAAECP